MIGFDGARDTPLEVLHAFLLGPAKYLIRDFMKKLLATNCQRLIASWDSFNTDSLHLAPLSGVYFVKHYKSLVGKHFKTVLQMAPFVFFQFMDEAQRTLWISLCNLAPLIYQTSIPILEDYLEELDQKTAIFLHHVVLMSARWFNKPKFHILDHLPLSIGHLGTASLFSTEKFESFNSLLRKASVHSNHQRPGHDLAVTFANYKTMRAILSGGSLFNHELKAYFEALSIISDLFEESIISQSMGYKDPNPPINYPYETQKKLPSESQELAPAHLLAQFPTRKIQPIHSLKLNDKNKIQKNSFVLVSHFIKSTHEGIREMDIIVTQNKKPFID
jgi:hypothetical protein